MKTIITILILCAASQAADVQLYQHRPYSMDEVSMLNKFELTILRNELFAMQGYVFSTEWLAAYFENQNWYSPSPSFTTAAEFPIEFTNEQQANIDLFIDAAYGLENAIHMCCYTEVSDLESGYYRSITFGPYLPPPPDFYGNFTSVEPDLGAHPELFPDELLPFDVFYELYSGYGYDETYEDMNAVHAILEQYNIRDKAVYKVWFRPDRTIARIEKITLDYMDPNGNRDPQVLWTAYYATNSIFIIFMPDCRMDWASRDLALVYTCEGNDLFLRTAFKGMYPELTMEIYEGPFSNLPISMEICSEDGGGYERYEELFTNRY